MRKELHGFCKCRLAHLQLRRARLLRSCRQGQRPKQQQSEQAAVTSGNRVA